MNEVTTRPGGRKRRLMRKHRAETKELERDYATLQRKLAERAQRSAQLGRAYAGLFQTVQQVVLTLDAAHDALDDGAELGARELADELDEVLSDFRASVAPQQEEA